MTTKTTKTKAAIMICTLALAGCTQKTAVGMIDSDQFVPVRVLCPGQPEFRGSRDQDGVTDEHGNRIEGWHNCVLIAKGPAVNKPTKETP